jgi:hypothetical protein
MVLSFGPLSVCGFEDAFGVASRLAERGRANAIQYPFALVPEQFAYLATAIAAHGDLRLADRLFDLVPPATVIGPYAMPVSLLRAAFTDNEDTREGARGVAQYLLASFEISNVSLRYQPDYRRLLPWNVGVSPEAVLMLAMFIGRGLVASDDLAITGQYSPIIWEASVSANAILRQQPQFQNISVPDLLADWLRHDD